MKGRSNYLCPRRLEIMRHRGPQNADEMRVLAKVLVWLPTSETGDRNEINLNGPSEREVWSRLSAEDDGCTTDNCLKRDGICPFYRARMAAQNAHILIVNHALLLADVATGNKVLPEYDYLIVDEAHHMEEATTNALSFRTTGRHRAHPARAGRAKRRRPWLAIRNSRRRALPLRFCRHQPTHPARHRLCLPLREPGAAVLPLH
jgi:DNA polymerase-3 subunit epsilon/ATP-dependent DNA helicase DinG